MARPISVISHVADVLSRYDHNRNGVIDLKRPDGFWNKLKNPDERVRSKVSSWSSDDSVTISSSVYSMDRLFYAADKDSDGKVTRDELEAVVKKYDKDNDGQLTRRGFFGWLFSFITKKPKGEFDLLKQDFGERLTNYGSVSIDTGK